MEQLELNAKKKAKRLFGNDFPQLATVCVELALEKDIDVATQLDEMLNNDLGDNEFKEGFPELHKELQAYHDTGAELTEFVKTVPLYILSHCDDWHGRDSMKAEIYTLSKDDVVDHAKLMVAEGEIKDSEGNDFDASNLTFDDLMNQTVPNIHLEEDELDLMNDTFVASVDLNLEHSSDMEM